MRREDQHRLRHMLEAARKVRQFLNGKSKDEFLADEVLVLAIVRLVEIIGEAAVNISREERDQLPQIPWKLAIQMRNRLVHVYFDVDNEIVWSTVTEDIPQLIAVLDPLVAAAFPTPEANEGTNLPA
jgi:uncharacterized protein with HEPN domain